MMVKLAIGQAQKHFLISRNFVAYFTILKNMWIVGNTSISSLTFIVIKNQKDTYIYIYMYIHPKRKNPLFLAIFQHWFWIL